MPKIAMMQFTRLVWRRLRQILMRATPAQRERYRLSVAYLRGDGIEVGALHNPLRVSSSARVLYVDRLARSDLMRHYPELEGSGVIDPDIVDDGERLGKIADHSLDFVIANHFIEHCENPILTLQNFLSKLRPGGVIYMAVPDKCFTFDRQRSSTSFAHLEKDYLDQGVASREAHYVDFVRYSHFRDQASADEIGRVAVSLMADSYSIHFHVWDFSEFQDFLRQACLTYLPELDIVESRFNRKEGIFILRRLTTGSR